MTTIALAGAVALGGVLSILVVTLPAAGLLYASCRIFGVDPSYRCQGCGRIGLKLWREYQTFVPTVLCCVCAGADQGEGVSSIDADGRRRRHSDLLPADLLTDQIGWYVPAIPGGERTRWGYPVKDGTYWGYSSVPPEAIQWWKNLPTGNYPGRDNRLLTLGNIS